MSVLEVSAGAVNRLHDKLSLADLHDRLSHYIRHVQDLKYKVNAVDSSAFLDSIKILEDGLHTLKHSYEQELNKARNEIDDLKRSRNDYAQQMQKSRDLANDLETKLLRETDKNKRSQDEMNSLHRTVAQKSSDIQEAHIAMQEPIKALDETTREYEKLMRENQDLKRKYDTEQLNRQECEDKYHQLHQKANFAENMHRQESQDLKERLHSADNTIMALESKVRELARPDTSLSEMLARVRESAEAQLRMYREESEQIFSSSLTALKAQIDTDTRKIEELTNRNVRMVGEIGELMSTIRKMEGQIAALDHHKQSLEQIMQREREEGATHIRYLEGKQKDMQDIMVVKMRELNAARDAQLPLKAEIEALRALLHEEERRLAKLPELGLTMKPSHGQSGPLRVTAVLPRPPDLRPRFGSRDDPVGPVRARSAPARQPRVNLIPTALGQGKDYFDNMFNDLKNGRNDNYLKVHGSDSGSLPPEPPESPLQESVTSPSTMTRPGGPTPASMTAPSDGRTPSVTSHDFTTATSSATGNLRITEVSHEGTYLKIANAADSKEEEFGGFMIQQNVGGHPVAMYRFPPRLRIAPQSTVTVWAGCNDVIMHQPPTDFVYKEQLRWGTGPECTTILCKPNGQAVAWTTAAHRFSHDAFDNASQPMMNADVIELTAGGGNENNNNRWISGGDSDRDTMSAEEDLPELEVAVNGAASDAVYLRREREEMASLAAQRHPHGQYPAAASHPNHGQHRVKTHGNDNSSVNRQTRAQCTKPDPIPGAPYAGANAQRMGSCSLRRFSPSKPAIRGSGAIANKAEYGIVVETAATPSAFQKPRDRFMTGLDQVRSQHNEDFLPPMPRPPLFSAW